MFHLILLHGDHTTLNCGHASINLGKVNRARDHRDATCFKERRLLSRIMGKVKLFCAELGLLNLLVKGWVLALSLGKSLLLACLNDLTGLVLAVGPQSLPTLPAEVEQVVFKALSKQPKARFACVDDFAKALQAASQQYVVPPLAFSTSSQHLASPESHEDVSDQATQY